MSAQTPGSATGSFHEFLHHYRLTADCSGTRKYLGNISVSRSQYPQSTFSTAFILFFLKYINQDSDTELVFGILGIIHNWKNIGHEVGGEGEDVFKLQTKIISPTICLSVYQQNVSCDNLLLLALACLKIFLRMREVRCSPPILSSPATENQRARQNHRTGSANHPPSFPRIN